jgi:lactate dehydrogenase-like 2-hydroxyacid dehydrogenase
VTKPDVLVPMPMSLKVMASLDEAFRVHRAWEAADPERFLARVAEVIRGIAAGNHSHVDSALIERLPRLEIVANFGVGYDSVDVDAAAEHGVIVTNTPDVLTEEVADTAIGLLLMTVRELSAAERHLRKGKWQSEGAYPLTASLRGRTVGIVGLGRIGAAIARRLDAMQVRVVYHARHKREGVPYSYFADVREMAEAVDTLVVVLPGTASTRNLIDADVLKVLGPDGVLVNIGRGSAVDEAALIEALRNRTILAAGLDVFTDEPNVPEALIALDNAVLLPHVGSASAYTRDAMGQLVVDNLKSWFGAGKPLTPVAETPWPRSG